VTQRPPIPFADTRPAAATLALALLALFVVFAHLGEGHLANFDDCYYAEKAKEMVRGGDWITPHYDGLVSLDNPPLFLWIMAGSFLLFGIRDYAAILPSAVSGVLCIVLLHRLALRLRLGPFAAGCAAFALLTTQYFLKYSRHAMFDVFLTLLFLLAIAAYLRARDGRPWGYALLGVLCGLGVLTKNVLGLFPLAAVVLHLAWTGRGRDLARPAFLAAPLALAAVVAPWYLAMLGGAHRAQFIEEHFRWLLLERGLGIGNSERGWTNYLGYFRDLATYYWPWLPVAAWGIVLAVRSAARGTRSARRDSHCGEARMPLRAQTSTSSRPDEGGANQALAGSAPTTSNRMGAAAEWPVRPGRPTPSALPTQTPTAWRGVTPTAHASRKP
jgi:4-amino-4-deoxy-L-arabinose transferase-like glycosyltransferase